MKLFLLNVLLKVFMFLKVCYSDQVELEAGCRSLLIIRGDNLQFYPNFALFSPLGGCTSTTIFFQVSKLSGDQKKKVFTKSGTLFFPNFRWKPKKNGLHQKNENFVPQVLVDICAQMHTRVKLLGGCRCRLYSNYWRGYS